MSSGISVVEFDMCSLFLHGFSYLFHVIVINLSDSKRNLRTELLHQIKLYNLYNSFLTIKAKLYENWVVNVLFCLIFIDAHWTRYASAYQVGIIPIYYHSPTVLISLCESRP